MKKKYFEHLSELKSRLLIWLGSIILFTFISYIYIDNIYDFLLMPLINGNEIKTKIIYTGLAEVFVTYIKLSLLIAFSFTLPILAIQIYGFVAPGLYKKERRSFRILIFAMPILFFCGAIFAYYFVIPLAWKFFLGFQKDNNLYQIVLENRVSEYFDSIIAFIFAFGLCFQLPVIILILNFMNIITIEMLVKYRRYAIILIFIIAAILTPPDVISQIALALPMVMLYELSIILARSKLL